MSKARAQSVSDSGAGGLPTPACSSMMKGAVQGLAGSWLSVVM